MKVYIKVKASEESPNESMPYITISDAYGVRLFLYDTQEKDWFDRHKIIVSDNMEYWLKEIELPDVTIEPVINMDKVIISEPDMINGNQSKPSGK